MLIFLLSNIKLGDYFKNYFIVINIKNFINYII